MTVVLNDIQKVVLQLWLENKSAGEIGKVINRSRSAVIGLVDRMRKKGVDVPRRSQMEATIAANKARGKSAQQDEPTPTVEEVLQRSIVEDIAVQVQAGDQTVDEITTKNAAFDQTRAAREVTIFQLREGICRFPVAEPLPRQFFYCGAPKEDITIPYCNCHARRAFVAQEQRQARRKA